jgi:hypothetical protein
MSEQAKPTVQHTEATGTGPSFALIIEWDNARLSELGRTRQMLKALQEQLVAYRFKSNRPPQIVILYDQGRVGSDIIHQTIEETIDFTTLDAIIKVIPTEGLGYYELKNAGVAHTDNDVILFIDSDTIPEQGWLDALMSAIQRPDVDVVGGNTYVAPDTFLAKSFGLFWFFEMRSKSDDLYPYDHFYANNVAIRRELVERYPYPNLESFRGQCHVLSIQMRNEGHRIWKHGGARMAHPTTNGFRHFWRRAICEGHDEMTLHRSRKAGRLLTSPAGSLIRLLRDMRSMAGRVAHHHKDVGLSATGAVGALCVGSAYCALKFFGDVVTYIDPNIVRRRWPI